MQLGSLLPLSPVSLPHNSRRRRIPERIETRWAEEEGEGGKTKWYGFQQKGQLAYFPQNGQ